MNKCINNENARDARLSLATKNPPTVNSRLTWLGKERDAESGLGDHGVRKYDNQTERFTATDPLYEKYINWTPYQAFVSPRCGYGSFLHPEFYLHFATMWLRLAVFSYEVVI